MKKGVQACKTNVVGTCEIGGGIMSDFIYQNTFNKLLLLHTQRTTKPPQSQIVAIFLTKYNNFEFGRPCDN